MRSLREGAAEGPLLAACLPSAGLLLGTPWQPEYDGRLLVVETPPDYRPSDADRDLWHLRNAGVLSRLAGMVVGRPAGHDERAARELWRVVVDATEPYGYPVAAGLEMVREIGFDGLVIVEPFNADVRALPPPERVAAVAAPLAAVWPG
jgi:muramoyltetrapeptide carboxypeptidase